jgi:hypothetical protein
MKRKLSVVAPLLKFECPVSRDSMTPQGEGRYCGKCDKVVVDLSECTFQEAVARLQKRDPREGQLCVSYFVTEGGQLQFRDRAKGLMVVSVATFLAACRTAPAPSAEDASASALVASEDASASAIVGTVDAGTTDVESPHDAGNRATDGAVPQDGGACEPSDGHGRGRGRHLGGEAREWPMDDDLLRKVSPKKSDGGKGSPF